MRLVVLRKGRSSAGQEDVTLQFGEGAPIKTSLLSYTDDGNHMRVVSVNVPMTEFRRNQKASSIRISSGPLKQTFAVSQMPQILDELDKCLGDLQEVWNAGPSRASRILREASPKQPIHRYFGSFDYPSPALQQGESGAVRIVFLVDEAGKVSDCSVDQTSGVSSLDVMSCYIIESRAKFDPALGPDGKPTKSAYCFRVVWIVSPGKKLPPPADRKCAA